MMVFGKTVCSRPELLPTLLVVFLMLAGCATTQDTPQQAYVWEMGRICDGKSPFWRMERVEADGRYWVHGAANAPPGMNDYFACMKEQFAKTPYRTWVGQRSASPQIATPTPSPAGSVAPSAAAPTTQQPATSAAIATRPNANSMLRPDWAVGDEWSYRWQSPRGGGTFVWVVDRFETIEGMEAVVIKSGSRDSFHRVSDGAHFLERVNGVVEVRNAPPVNMMLLPLAVGKTWSPSYTRELPAARQTQDMLLDCRVDGEESVSVPAGTFRTFHIICLNQRSGTLNFERWYAPEVANMVKERTSFTYGIRERELLGFKRAERR